METEIMPGVSIEELVGGMHRLVDRWGQMLRDPVMPGALPSIRVTMRSKAGGAAVCFIVGAEYPDDPDESDGDESDDDEAVH